MYFELNSPNPTDALSQNQVIGTFEWTYVKFVLLSLDMIYV